MEQLLLVDVAAVMKIILGKNVCFEYSIKYMVILSAMHETSEIDTY